MFGTNVVRKVRINDDGLYLDVVEIFSTIQGEGPFAGCPAVFIRLAGCNLRCHFCDTEFENGKILSVQEIAAIVKAEPNWYEGKLIVLTGGEPLRQNVAPLIQYFAANRCPVQIETAGTLWPAYLDAIKYLICSGDASIVCSPKTPTIHRTIEELTYHYKYIVSADDCDPSDGLPIMSTQTQGEHARLFRPKRMPRTINYNVAVFCMIWVQPRHDYILPVLPRAQRIEEGVDPYPMPDRNANQRNMAHAAHVAMQYGYRVSLQLHRYLNLP